MDFELSDDQVALADGVRSFCEGRFPMAAVRALADEGGVDRARWRELGDLGVFSLRLPADEGGAELGWADAVVAFEELGRALVPGPLVWTQVLAGASPAPATGETVVGGLDRGRSQPGRGVPRPPRRAGRGRRGRASGASTVADLEHRAAAPPRPAHPRRPADRGAAPRASGPGRCRAVALSVHVRARCSPPRLLLGVAEAATAVAVDYARERQQFGRPIGAFQAMKHIMADMFTRAEVARGAVYAAGVTLDDPAVGSVERAAAAAKLTAAEAALANGKSCVQVHGGMGYTWEIDAHLFLKRAYALEPAFGTRDDWADAMADLLDAAV